MMMLFWRDENNIDGPTQNALYELVVDFGEAYAPALRRDSYLARGIDRQENWLELDTEIGETRAKALYDGAEPSKTEFHLLCRWQVARALEMQDPDHVLTLWLCRNGDRQSCALIEGWGKTLGTELKFEWIDSYSDEAAAIDAIHARYILRADDLDPMKIY